jgi:hypothetical protein
VTTRGNAEYPCAVDGCGLQAHERRICGVCAGNLERDLAEMPALLDDLSVTLSRQARIGGHTNGSRAFERPLPFDPRASEAGDVLRSTLVGWIRDLHDGAEYWPVDSLHGMALWLYRRLSRLLDHPAAEEAVDEIRFAVGLCKRVTDKPANRTAFAVGPCPELDEQGVQCPGEVRAFIPSTEDRPARMQCEACGAAWLTFQWLRAGRRILDRIEQTA